MNLLHERLAGGARKEREVIPKEAEEDNTAELQEYLSLVDPVRDRRRLIIPFQQKGLASETSREERKKQQ